MVEACSWLCRRSANPMCLNKPWLPRLAKVSHLCMHGTSCLSWWTEMTPFAQVRSCASQQCGVSLESSSRQCSRCSGPCYKDRHLQRFGSDVVSSGKGLRSFKSRFCGQVANMSLKATALKVPQLQLTLQGLWCHSRADSVHKCGVVSCVWNWPHVGMDCLSHVGGLVGSRPAVWIYLG